MRLRDTFYIVSPKVNYQEVVKVSILCKEERDVFLILDASGSSTIATAGNLCVFRSTGNAYAVKSYRRLYIPRIQNILDKSTKVVRVRFFDLSSRWIPRCSFTIVDVGVRVLLPL